MPKTRAGTHAPARAELFAAVASPMPSSDPRPYCSGVFEVRFEAASETQAPISAPAPGSIPTTEPITPERSACHFRRHNSGKAGPNTIRVGVTRNRPRSPSRFPAAGCSIVLVFPASLSITNTFRRISETPNRPIIAGMKFTPW